jgi:DNA-binding CsgD family transcriptional regulator
VEKRSIALVPGGAGFILVDSDWRLVYANPEAKSILTYPKAPRKFKLAQTPVQKKIFPLPANQNFSSPSTTHAEFMSGRRKYVSRAFSLTRPQNGRPPGVAAAVVLERKGAASYVIADLCDHFSLTERERQVVEFLIQGFTNKEIAARMDISHHTVRAFLRIVMVKLGVSTRSGIIGILFRAIFTPPAGFLISNSVIRV